MTKAGQKQAWAKVTKTPPCSLLMLVSAALRNKHTCSALELKTNSAIRELKPSAQAQLCYLHLSCWGRKTVKGKIPQARQPLVHSFILPRKPALKNSHHMTLKYYVIGDITPALLSFLAQDTPNSMFQCERSFLIIQNKDIHKSRQV